MVRFPHNHLRLPVPALLSLVLVGGLPSGARAEDAHWDPVTAAELADNTPKIEPSAAAEILTYRIDVDDTQSWRNLDSRIRFKIYDPDRANDITRIARFWSGYANRNYTLMARLTLPDGSSRVFDQNDLQGRHVAENGGVNSLLGKLESRSGGFVEQQFLAVTGVVKGAILDVWEENARIAKAHWMSTSIQRADAPIRNFKYVFRFQPDPNSPQRSFVLNPQGGKATHDDKAGVFIFTAENLPTIRFEPFAPPETYFSLSIIETYETMYRGLSAVHLSVPIPKSVPLSLGPWAFFSTAQDFQDADKGYVSSRVKEKSAQLTAGIDDPREKAKRIYDFVESTYQRFRNRADLEKGYTRYVESIDELIDLDQIDSTIILSENFRYLFIGLCRAAGIECHSALHPDRNAFRFRTEMVSDQFLKYWSVALHLGNGWVLCDPCEDVPLAFGALPWQFEGQPALVALPRRQAFLNVMPPGAEHSVASDNSDLQLEANGDLHGTCTVTFTGHEAQVVRETLHTLANDQWAAETKSILGLGDSSCDVTLGTIDGLDTPESPVRITATVFWYAYGAVVKDRMTVPLSAWTQGKGPVLNDSVRTTPVFFDFPHVDEEVLTIHLPPGYDVGTLPDAVDTGAGAFAYSLGATSVADQRTLVVHRSSKIGAIEIPVAAYDSARDWFRNISADDHAIAVLIRTPAK